MGRRHLVNDKTFRIALNTMAAARELKKCVEFFHSMNACGYEYSLDTLNKVVETLCGNGLVEEAKLVIGWMCKRGKTAQAYMMFDEMHERGIQVDNLTLASLIYGLLVRGRVREAYRVVEGTEKLDISVYHGLIKGLLRLRRASEATQVFREMIKKGCEPTMHTYIMLLQGYLGKRGRKGTDTFANFETIFVGGLVKAGKSLEATKYVERSLRCPDLINKFLHYYSNEEGVVMFEEVAKKLREVGSVDLAEIFESVRDDQSGTRFELVGSAVANQSLHIDGQDGEGKVKFVLQSVLTRLMFASKESPNHVG
nr:putative pentatricopeptide repeat-containing protein [Quercus suber]